MHAVKSAMRAVVHIMNDDLDSAEAGLANGNSSFHKVRHPHYVLPDLEADSRWSKECTLMPILCWDVDGKGNGRLLESYPGFRARCHERRYEGNMIQHHEKRLS